MTNSCPGGENFMQALVIDDEPQMRKFVSEILRDEGWEVTEAASAEQAFELMREREWCGSLLRRGIGWRRRFQCAQALQRGTAAEPRSS